VIDLEISRLRAGAALPSSAYPDDAGLDLTACDAVVLGPGERAVVGTGICVAVPTGHAGLVLPRSGLAAHHGLSIVNAPGLIDAGYRGEVKVVLLNTDREQSFAVELGMRIAQLVVVRVPTVNIVETDTLGATPRDASGFGSSGR
jgi:dUTP pyrophosphatase